MHSYKILDHCEADVKLDWTDDNISFSCICLSSLVGEAPAQQAGGLGLKCHRWLLVGVFKSSCGGNGSGAS
jgi:hypothetical protein